MSLHYIFWHWPRAGVDVAVYAGRLVRFQEELENHLGGDLQGETAAFRSAAPPWTPAEATVFSDWYTLVDGSRLDALNNGAIGGPAVIAAHAEIAALYGGGAGSLYDFKRGTAAFDPAYVQYTHWFPKPAGMSYDDFYALLEPFTGQDNAWLLRRRMVLGPSPEFCLASAALHQLPEQIVAYTLPMNRL